MPDQVEEWVVLELSPRSEGEDPELVRSAICKMLAGAEVFIPAVVTEVGGDRSVHYLVDGYAFVRHKHPTTAYSRLEGTRYVQAVLREPGRAGQPRKVSTVPTADINKMRRQVEKEVHQGIGIGDLVQITTGAYRNIEATVIEEIPEQQMVQVHVRLRSKQTILMIPRSGLIVLERAPFSPANNHLTVLRTWLQKTRPILLWRPRFQPAQLQRVLQEYSHISRWMDQGRRLYSFVSFAGSSAFSTRLTQIRVHRDRLRSVDQWAVRGSQLHTFVSSYYQGDRQQHQLQAIRGRVMELVWLDDVLQRIKRLRRDVDNIGRKADRDRKVTQNLLIDGHNLAFRCLYAPGMSDLSTKDGRPTGVILGFLRVLGSLHKRFPDARIYVTWDGSSQRRKALFADYKGNRPSRSSSSEGGEPVFDQIGFLVKALPLLGVWQVTNPQEEADDILAALVRGELADQYNLIFSNDRDLLQLVTEKTEQLVPGTGSRKEIRFTQDLVLKNFGVLPEKMVQLRSFFGDSSDNIPGVPRVPKKVLTSLVQAHGSIDGVYGSGLPGVSKGQYERLRLAEPQVRINQTLMSLVDVPVSITPPDTDQAAATTLLQDVEINPQPILEALFGKTEIEDA